MTTKWVAYTDGACAPTNPGPAAWGVVVFAPDGSEQAADHGFIGPGTNQIAEITAAIEGLLRTPEGVAVELVSASTFSRASANGGPAGNGADSATRRTNRWPTSNSGSACLPWSMPGR